MLRAGEIVILKKIHCWLSSTKEQSLRKYAFLEYNMNRTDCIYVFRNIHIYTITHSNKEKEDMNLNERRVESMQVSLKRIKERWKLYKCIIISKINKNVFKIPNKTRNTYNIKEVSIALRWHKSDIKEPKLFENRDQDFPTQHV